MKANNLNSFGRNRNSALISLFLAVSVGGIGSGLGQEGGCTWCIGLDVPDPNGYTCIGVPTCDIAPVEEPWQCGWCAGFITVVCTKEGSPDKHRLRQDCLTYDNCGDVIPCNDVENGNCPPCYQPPE